MVVCNTNAALVPLLHNEFGEPTVELAILEALDMTVQAKIRHLLYEISCWQSLDVFVVLPMGRKVIVLCFIPYIYDSLRRAAGERDAHYCIAVVV